MRNISIHKAIGSTMRRGTLAIILACATVTGSVAQSATSAPLPGMQPESLPYDVIYELGVLWKRAATATLQLSKPSSNGVYKATLKAKTLPFADRIFRVRDTLVSQIKVKNDKIIPLYYAKLSDEDGTYRKDEVRYSYNGSSTTGAIRLYRPKRNAIENYTLTERGEVYDMLSIFYVIRSFDFRNMKMNQVYKTKIFSGKNLEYLEIEYQGQSILKQNKKEYNAFRVNFRFYDRSGKKTSDKISAWISTDERRIPLKLEGKLALGSMKAVYTGDK